MINLKIILQSNSNFKDLCAVFSLRLKNGPEGPFLLNTEVFTSLKLNYFNKAKTDCDDWFACANIAVAACEMICDLARLVVSVA